MQGQGQGRAAGAAGQGRAGQRAGQGGSAEQEQGQKGKNAKKTVQIRSKLRTQTLHNFYIAILSLTPETPKTVVLGIPCALCCFVRGTSTG